MIKTILKGGRASVATLAIVTAGLFTLQAQDAHAVVVNVDPGTVGSIIQNPSYDVTADVQAAIGSTADGSSNLLEFVFTDNKTIGSPVEGMTVLVYNLSLRLVYENGFTAAVPADPVVFITDENGANIGDGDGFSSFPVPPDNNQVRYIASFDPVTQDIFRGVTFSIVLPDDLGAGQLLSATLVGSSDFPFVIGQSTVVSLLEPGTIVLFGAGLAGLGLAARRRRIV